MAYLNKAAGKPAPTTTVENHKASAKYASPQLKTGATKGNDPLRNYGKRVLSSVQNPDGRINRPERKVAAK